LNESGRDPPVSQTSPNASKWFLPWDDEWARDIYPSVLGGNGLDESIQDRPITQVFLQPSSQSGWTDAAYADPFIEPFLTQNNTFTPGDGTGPHPNTNEESKSFTEEENESGDHPSSSSSFHEIKHDEAEDERVVNISQSSPPHSPSSFVDCITASSDVSSDAEQLSAGPTKSRSSSSFSFVEDESQAPEVDQRASPTADRFQEVGEVDATSSISAAGAEEWLNLDEAQPAENDEDDIAVTSADV